MERLLSYSALILLMLTLAVSCQKDEINTMQPTDLLELRTLNFDLATLQLIHDALLEEVNDLIEQGVLNPPMGNGLIPLLNNMQRAIDDGKVIKANQKLEEDIIPHLAGLLADGVLTQDQYDDLFKIATHQVDEGTVSLGGVAYHWKIMADGKKWLVENMRYPVNEGTQSWYYPVNSEDPEVIESNHQLYGMLYTLEAANSVCPLLGEGWRLPSRNEWYEMGDYYGDWLGLDNALAYPELLHPMYGTNPSTNFNAVFGGRNKPIDGFYDLTHYGYYWSSSPGFNPGYYSVFYFRYWNGDLSYGDFTPNSGLSCRCVCDVE